MMTVSPNWKGRPYFIYANDFIYKSAGVKLLHYLCHLINEAGYRAFITPCITSPVLNTPILNHDVIEYYKSNNIEPIAIYGERVDGNPLNVKSVVRYLGNYINHFNDLVSYNENDFILSYSEGMNNLGMDEVVLHIPLVDTKIFNQLEVNLERNGKIVYAGKYIDVHGGELLPEHQNLYQITRNENSESPEALKKLFQTSEVLYVYENTALSIEAVLCGCPVILVPNEYFDKIIGEKEYKRLGMGWGLDQKELIRARATLSEAKVNYQNLITQVKVQLANFLEKSQSITVTPIETQICLNSTSSVLNYRFSNIDTINYKWLKQKSLGLILILTVIVYAILELGFFNFLKKIFKIHDKQKLKTLFIKYHFKLFEKLP